MNECHPLNEDAWAEWVEFRTIEKRKKIGPLAQKKQVQMLCKYDQATQQKMIDTSIMNSWQGLFPEKESNNGHNRSNGKTNSRGPEVISLTALLNEGHVIDG